MDRIRDPSPKGKETIIRVGLLLLGNKDELDLDKKGKPLPMLIGSLNLSI
jgi:hypothetical protein